MSRAGNPYDNAKGEGFTRALNLSYDERRTSLHHADAAPGDDRPGRREIAEGIAGYVVGLFLAALITVVAFFVAETTLVWQPIIPIALLVLAIGQIGVHLVFFIHHPQNVAAISTRRRCARSRAATIGSFGPVVGPINTKRVSRTPTKRSASRR